MSESNHGAMGGLSCRPWCLKIKHETFTKGVAQPKNAVIIVSRPKEGRRHDPHNADLLVSGHGD